MKHVEEQRVEIYSLEENIQGMIKGIKMMNSNTVVLDEIILQGKRSGDNTVIGFYRENRKKRMTSPTRKWVAAGAKPNDNSERRFHEFSSKEGIKHEYSAPITPQQNDIVERKNKTL
ncbi:hypothetical protein LIER_23496 [Lithospermum erythrorhizon]|uniref:Integrase catalytic domain-containing protein n=1 Tax=Lithospermum erythrorhizon TaxID=34254 RepID=A0AAV3QZ14_LITER